MPRFLHVGCGRKRKAHTIKPFAAPDWEEVSLDIDESVAPDIVDKLPELALVESGSFDAVYSSHSLEHLYPHEVPVALRAFLRVLKDDGVAIVRCPDLQAIGKIIASGDIDKPLYTSLRGPVSALDMLYGFRPAMQEGNLYMAHQTGFTSRSLRRTCLEAGFAGFLGASRVERKELWGIATKAAKTPQEFQELFKIYVTPV